MSKKKLSHRTSYIITMSVFFLVWLILLIAFIVKQNNAYNAYLSIPEDDTSLREERYNYFVEYFTNKFIVFLIGTVSLLFVFPIFQSFYFYLLTLKKATFKKQYHKFQLILWALSIIFAVTITLVYLDQYHDTYLLVMSYGIVPLMTLLSVYFGYRKIY